MSMEKYINYLILKIKPGVSVNWDLWEKFDGMISFTYKEMAFRDFERIIKNSADLKKFLKVIIELIDYQERTGVEAFKIVNKNSIGEWSGHSLYQIEGVKVDWGETGWFCSTVADKQLVVKNNEVKGFLRPRFNKFYEAPQTEQKLDINGILPSEYSFKELSKEEVEENYPGLLEVFKDVNTDLEEMSKSF